MNSSLSFSDGSKDQPREVHFWEFPLGFFVKLETTIAKELVKCAAETVGGINHLARVLKNHVDTIYSYRACRAFIPLASLLILSELAGDEFAIEKLESYVVAYKGGPNATPIRNPRLPLVETPDLFMIMGHLMGDGGHGNSQTSYVNTQELLIRRFLGLLGKMFGEVPVHVVFEKKEAPGQSIFRILFGMSIVRLFRHLYHVDFRTFTARVPHRLFELPREYAAAFLQAFGDDEGCVQDSCIQLYSANKELMQDIYDLFQTKFPELEEFIVFEETKKKFKMLYSVRFRVGAYPSYRTLIGFTHPEKRQELDQILARKERGWKQRNPGTTRRMLLEELSSTPKTTKDLARKLGISVVPTRCHLKGLIEWGCVRVRGKLGKCGAKVFEITGRGRKFLQLPSIELLSGRIGRTKVTILMVLTKGSLMTKEIGQKLGLTKSPIQSHLTGSKKGRPGLLKLGLVERSGSRTSEDPYVYRLTDEGRLVVEVLEPIFKKQEYRAF